MDPEAANVLHDLSQRASWSRANEKGVFPGVATPLNWSIWGEIGERGVRRAGFELGLLAEEELAPPPGADDRMWSIFYGRPAANVDSWRMLYERGATTEGHGSAAQRQVFGTPSTAETRHEVVDRSAAIGIRRPVALRETPRRLRTMRAEMEDWWLHATRAETLCDRSACERVLAEAIERFDRADPDHIVVSLLATEAVTGITSAAERIGRPELANALMVGYPGMEEFRTTVALWDLSRGALSLDAFLAAHGFHGPQEGEIASRSWRERPAPVLALADRFRTLPEEQDPRHRELASLARREALESELLEAVAPEDRADLDEALARAATFLPLREAGRATLTIALDAMRASARRLAADCVRMATLEDVEDVFLLTRDELLDLPAQARDRVSERRSLRTCYERFELPESWTGMPEKQPVTRPDGSPSRGVEHAALDRGDRLEGLGASAGIHEGLARVVLDPEQLSDAFEPGDVLVAPATDPSWAPFFLVAGAVVIDTGSNISHAAVVAREMGIPAVVSARGASQRLVTGQRLRVDGGAGTVEVLA
jgi:pyruvate,water dikinase